MRIAVSAAYRLEAGAGVHLYKLLQAWVQEGQDRAHDITVFTRPESNALLAGPKVAVESGVDGSVGEHNNQCV